MPAQIPYWSGAMKTVPDLSGPDSPGAQPAGGSSSAFALTTLATTGALALPARPASAPATPTEFLQEFSGNLTGGVTITAQVDNVPAAAGDYLPGDVVRVMVTPRTKGNQTVAVVDGGGSGTLVTMPALTANSQGGYIDIQLNAAGTHWTLIAFAGF
jgi:hypothetical protein